MSTLIEEKAAGWPALRWVSTNNPFYVISAGLFLAGLWLSFGDPRQLQNLWALMAGLAGYTLLLAATACFLVRFVKLWDDARTVLLLVVLMFLATSVTFDEVLVVAAVDQQNGSPLRGILCYVIGLMFAVAVSELALRGIGLKLPGLYRGPYYLMLALFFLYPPALTSLLRDPESESLQWGLFGFSAAAGLAFLTLLPAIRRGAKYVKDNGSPWPWPMYPWSLFVFLAVAVIGRAFLLCWSMHPIVGAADANRLIFGPYFLVPFGLALAVLILEMALTSRRAFVFRIALSLPVMLIFLSMIGHRSDPIYQRFLTIFGDRLGGDPVYATLLGAVIFYGYAAIRRTAWALEAMTATLGLLALVGPESLKQGVLADPMPAPFLAAAMLLLCVGVLQGRSRRCLFGAVALVLAVTILIPPEASAFRWPIAFHGLFVATLVIGAAFDDELAHVLRYAGATLALVGGLGVLLSPLRGPAEIPMPLIELYPLALAGLLAAYGLWLRHRLSIFFAMLLFGLWAIASGWHIYRWLRQMIVGLDYLVLSFLVFAFAVLVSLGKAGILARWYANWRATDVAE